MKKISYIIISLYFITLVILNRQTLFAKTEISKLKSLYEGSNYVLGDRGNKMSDDDVYTYAGYVYASGASPLSVNFEHPPFMKYLYGFSVDLFGNPSWIIVGFMLVQALCLVYLADDLYKNKKLLVAAVVFFLSNSLVYSYFTKALLDVPLAGMMLLSIFTYLRYMKHPSVLRGVLFGSVIGLYFSTKYPFPLSIGLYGLLLISVWLKYKNIWHMAIMLGSTAAAYLSTYIMFFLQGNSLIDYLRFEIWRLHWYLGKADAPRALILHTVLFGRHTAWWAHDNSMVVYPNYTILWPISFILFIVSFAKRIQQKTFLIPLKVWTLLSFLILMIGASNDFYLIPLLPGFVLFGIKMFDKEGKSQ